MALSTITIRDGNGAAQSVPVHLGYNGEVIPTHSLDNGKPTFAYSGVFTPYATSAIVVVNIKGSATKTLRIVRFAVSGFSTGAGSFIAKLVRASTEGTGGTKAALTAAPADPLHITAATGVVNTFTTAAQSAGTAVATLGCLNINTTAAAGNGGNVAEFLRSGESIVLRGVADFLELQNANAGNLAAGTQLAVHILIQEDAS
jgi:uncharacterized membrane protein YeiB